MSVENLIISNLEDQIKTINELKKSKEVIEKIYVEIKNAQKNNNKIFIMGNGGSASTSSHFVSDLLKTSLTKEANRIKAISLTDNIPVVMAWANDTSFESFVAHLDIELLRKT